MKTLISFKLLGGALIAAALHYPGFASGGSSGGKSSLTVHEWGTFTSVQGSDGEQLNWHPLAKSDLPEFVYNLFKPTSSTNLNQQNTREMIFSKGGLSAKQRMETPVLYFYSPTETKVNVQVNFPQGKMTEWFPEAAKWAAPPPKAIQATGTNPKPAEGMLLWKDVTVLANEGKATGEPAMLKEQGGSHYYAAREVDANFLRLKNADGKEETEKFLFYRGVAQFEAPLKVTVTYNNEFVVLENTSDEPLHDLVVLNIYGKNAKHLAVGSLGPKQKRQIAWPQIENGHKPLATVQTEASAKLHASLTAHGLFPREASSMINTWHDSWLTDQGLRVFYVLPDQWTDRTLPLQVTPRPDKVERVMVGRAEVITPQMEWSLMQQLVKYGTGNEALKQEALQENWTMGLGRFTQPAIRRVAGPNPSRELNIALNMFMSDVEKLQNSKAAYPLKKVAASKEGKAHKVNCASALDFGKYDILNWLDCGC